MKPCAAFRPTQRNYGRRSRGSGTLYRAGDFLIGHEEGQAPTATDERWVVVAGEALVTNGERIYTVRANESTFIPVRTRHRLENPGD